MKRIIFGLLASLFAVSASAAAGKTYKFVFDNVTDFKVLFADYPKGEEVFYELKHQIDVTLPKDITTNAHALLISGNNHSDDLFMYAYKKLTGLRPNTTYKASFILEFASNAPLNSSGVGGSPGDSVYVKIGVVGKEPGRYVDDTGHYRIDLDKGNQESDGKDMRMIGTVGVDSDGSEYKLKSLNYAYDGDQHIFTVTTNEKGEAWIVFGTDSGYESTSTIYYTNVVVALDPYSGS